MEMSSPSMRSSKGTFSVSEIVHPGGEHLWSLLFSYII
jgi:hypothetical protein